MTGHAPLAPSAAERWIACPGSYQAARNAPPAPSSEFAELGTTAHTWFATGLRRGLAAQVLTTDPLLQHPLELAINAARQILEQRSFMVELRLPALADLDRLEAMLRDAVQAAVAADAPRRAGAWCRFCAAAAGCPTRQAAPNAVPAARSAWFRPTPRWLVRP